jgi:hypothetical protein
MRDGRGGGKLAIGVVVRLDNLPLDSGHSPAIGIPVSGLFNVHITGSTHAVGSPIASSTDRLSSSNHLPSNLRSGA